jgi:hypothetical protein
MATFNTKTIEKITAKISEQTVPLIAKTPKEQEELFAKVKVFVEQDERLRAGNGSRSSANNRWTKYLPIDLKNYDYYFPSIPSILFDDLGRLVMYEDNYKAPYPIDFTTLPLVINEMFKLHKIEQADKKKKQKMRDLKTQGILARFKEIAKEDGFDYTYEQSTNKVVLRIQLPKNKGLHIDVPFSNFQEVMQNVRDLIKNVQELTNKGISFRIKG